MNNKSVVWWSGGKDSTAVILKLLELGYRDFNVVFIDTGIEFDEMYTYIERSKKYFLKFGIKVKTYKSKKYTWENMFYSIKQKGKNKGDNYGFPYTCGAWCNARLKVDPMNEAKKDFKDYIEIIGYAIDEKSKIRQLKIKNKLNGIDKFKTVKYVKDKKTKEIREVTLEHDISNERYLLAEHNMKESDCLELCKKHNLYNPLYDLFGRTGCWCCPKQPLASLRIIYLKMPEKWNQLRVWQKNSKNSFRPKESIFDLQERFESEIIESKIKLLKKTVLKHYLIFKTTIFHYSTITIILSLLNNQQLYKHVIILILY